MRTLMVRIASTGEVMLIVVFARPEQEKIDDLMGAIAAEFPEITSLLYVVNQKVNDTIADQEVITYRGRDYINEEMEGLQFRIGPKSFYQTNSLQAYELYKVARRMACLKPDDLVYDLYTGTGTIANFVARQVKKVVGIEYVPEAIADAKRRRGQRDSQRPPGTHRLRQLQPGDTSARPRPHGQSLPRGGSAACRHVPPHPPR